MSREASNGKNIRSKKKETKRLRDKIYPTHKNLGDPCPLIQFMLTSIILNSTAKFVTTAKSTQGATANCQWRNESWALSNVDLKRSVPLTMYMIYAVNEMYKIFMQELYNV